MKEYNPKEIESKWQKVWEETRPDGAIDFDKRQKKYVLDMFPYPSGAGLHVGHPEGYTATDIYSRYLRMSGYNVLHPMGWDAFGLPAENYAIKTGTHPKITTENNIKVFKSQLKKLGFSYDWDREINTTDPDYYKWTQWIFIKLLERGLAYESTAPINFCPSCKTGLANEEVENGLCERCKTPVERRSIRQWILKITKYADRLLNDLDKLDWPESIKEMQRNWIGRSEGTKINFKIISSSAPSASVSSSVILSEAKNPDPSSITQDDIDLPVTASEAKQSDDGIATTPAASHNDYDVEVFTTRADTLFGVTYVVLAPEHELVSTLKDQISNIKDVDDYISKVKSKSDLERTDLAKEKTGVPLEGIFAINPINGDKVPVWIADYVLLNYGTGAVMAVPAHDERDFEFAKKYNLPIKDVIAKQFGTRKDDAKRGDSVTSVITNAEGKVLILFNEQENLYRLPGGRIEGKETDHETLTREITEESGYQNFEILEPLGTIENNIFIPIYPENRIKLQKAYHVRLIDDKYQEQDSFDFKHYENVWLEPKEAIKRLKSNKELWGEYYFIERYLDSNSQCVTDYGVLINSEEFNNLDSAEGKKEITDKLKSAGLGDFTVSYKLRDWIFSRQRYWGEPIPVVHCENCAKELKQTFLIIHGICGNSKENWFPWFKEELERMGHTVIIPDLPNADHPSFDEWQQALSDIKDQLTENTVIIAHSLGAPVACKFIERENLKVKKLILVGPTGKAQKSESLEGAGFSKGIIDDIFLFNNVPVDYSKVKDLVKHRYIYLSDNDPYIPADVVHDYADLDTTVRHFSNKGHFNKSAGITEFPELFDDIKPLPVGIVPVLEKDLPVTLPDVREYEPSGTGESPLANIADWVNTTCPKCGGPAKRETNTMPQWAGSCWYYLAFILLNSSNTTDNNSKDFWDKKKIDYWMPVDLYVGGAEHAVLHLLYARFWHKFLYDIGVVNTDEPFMKLRNQGLILAEDGRKMSKSFGNVINPDDIVNEYGADTLRLYEMFMGPFEMVKRWDSKSISGVYRFLKKVYRLAYGSFEGNTNELLLNRTINKVTQDIVNFRFNTAISSLMIMSNELESRRCSLMEVKTLVTLLAPFAPHLSEELWQILGQKGSVFESRWPVHDETKIVAENVEIVVQINSKIKARLSMTVDSSEAEITAEALKNDKISELLQGKKPHKVIFVKNKLVNLLV